MAVNWQHGKSLKESILHLFNEQIGVDISFKVGEEIVKGHKVILAARSPKLGRVFDNKMFSSDLDLEMDGKNIVVKGVEPDMFREFMRFVYSEEVELTDENAIPLLALAQRFDITPLEALCAEKLENAITPENVFSFANQACNLQATTLIEKCLKVFSEHTKTCIKSEKFNQSSKEALSVLLDVDAIECRELDLFKAVYQWTEVECKRLDIEPTKLNKRKALGDVLYKLRLPTLNLWEFARYVSQSGLLTNDDLANLYMILTIPPTEREEVTTRFSVNIRDANSDQRHISQLDNYMIVRSSLRNIDAAFYSVRGTHGTENISSEKTTVLFKKANQFNMAMFFAV